MLKSSESCENVLVGILFFRPCRTSLGGVAMVDARIFHLSIFFIISFAFAGKKSSCVRMCTCESWLERKEQKVQKYV